MKEKKQESQSTPTPADVTILPPDFALKKAIGNVDMGKLLDKTVVEQAQKKIDGEQENFLKWIAEDVANIERVYADLVAHPEDSKVHITKLRDMAISVKSQAGTFGFDLASVIARSLYKFCAEFSFSEGQCLVVRKHIDAIKLILQKRITGDGGAIGKELLQDMTKLVNKFSNK